MHTSSMKLIFGLIFPPRYSAICLPLILPIPLGFVKNVTADKNRFRKMVRVLDRNFKSLDDKLNARDWLDYLVRANDPMALSWRTTRTEYSETATMLTTPVSFVTGDSNTKPWMDVFVVCDWGFITSPYDEKEVDMFLSHITKLKTDRTVKMQSSDDKSVKKQEQKKFFRTLMFYQFAVKIPDRDELRKSMIPEFTRMDGMSWNINRNPWPADGKSITDVGIGVVYPECLTSVKDFAFWSDVQRKLYMGSTRGAQMEDVVNIFIAYYRGREAPPYPVSPSETAAEPQLGVKGGAQLPLDVYKDVLMNIVNCDDRFWRASGCTIEPRTKPKDVRSVDFGGEKIKYYDHRITQAGEHTPDRNRIQRLRVLNTIMSV